jgi:hypothetical protein
VIAYTQKCKVSFVASDHVDKMPFMSKILKILETILVPRGGTSEQR